MHLQNLVFLFLLSAFACGSGTTERKTDTTTEMSLTPTTTAAFLVKKLVVSYSESGGPSGVVERREVIYTRDEPQVNVESQFINDPNRKSLSRLILSSEKFRSQVNTWIDKAAASKLDGEYKGTSAAGGSDFAVISFHFFTESTVTVATANTSDPSSLPFPLDHLYETFSSLNFQK